MEFIPLKFLGAYLIQLKPITDERGFFVRSFCQNELASIDLNFDIKQINQTLTIQKGSIRGMHFQIPPFSESKIVRCLSGKVFDVIIDLRKDSPTFLQWHGEILSGENMKALFIPKGFAHGFQTLEKNCTMLYFHDEFYNKSSEGGIMCNDPKISIEWEMKISDISSRDQSHKYLDDTFKGLVL